VKKITVFICFFSIVAQAPERKTHLTPGTGQITGGQQALCQLSVAAPSSKL